MDAVKLSARGRKFLFWSRIRKAALIFAAVTTVAAVIGIILSVAFVFMGVKLGDWTVVMSPGAGALTFMAVVLYNSAKDREKGYVPEPLRFLSYNLLLKSLSKMGVKNPVLYVEQHPANIAAFHRLVDLCRFKIDVPEQKKATVFNFWKQKKDWSEEQMVATLVLPGPNELAREARIEALVNVRGVRTYVEIKELLNQVEELPPALSEGAL